MLNISMKLCQVFFPSVKPNNNEIHFTKKNKTYYARHIQVPSRGETKYATNVFKR